MTVPELIAHVEGSIEKARRGESQMSRDVLAIRGMSTPTQRHLVSNMTRMPGGTRYCEVGLYAGSTFCAAMSNNRDLTAIGIDDHSQTFSIASVWDEFHGNFARFKGDPLSATFHNASAWDVAPKVEGPVDIFYYDGEHGEESQSKALPAFFHAMADNFIFMVDDTDWPQVKAGTEKGFATLAGKVAIDYTFELTERRPDGPIWHNGVLIFVCHKIQSERNAA